MVAVESAGRQRRGVVDRRAADVLRREPGDQEHWSGGCRRRTPTPSRACWARCCISKDAIADVNEQIKGGDFYRPAHETIYDAIVELYGRASRPTRSRWSAELNRRGELARGRRRAVPPHADSASVPIATNASLLRRHRPREGDPAPAGRRRHQDRADGLRRRGRRRRHRRPWPSRRSTRSARSAPQEDYAPLSAIMEATLDEIEAISNHDGTMRRRADRLRRPRRAGQRLPGRPDDHRRRPARGREVDAGAGLLPGRVDRTTTRPA